MSSVNIHPAASYELGARFYSHYPLDKSLSGVQFALSAPGAHKVELCLFDDDNREVKITIPNQYPYLRNDVWRLFVPDIKPGQQYGYRVHGEWNPQVGQRHNPAKLLIDPYAQKLNGEIQWHDSLFDYTLGENEEWRINELDSAGFTPKSVVVEHEFDWGNVAPPAHQMVHSIIYELNVRGFTMQHPEIPEELRGTYLGLCQPAVIDYLKKLGVTAVELLPVTSFGSEQRLDNQGLENYWGYNPLALMAPEASMAVDDPVNELKIMVKCLHQAGIEVILDVVFNHTTEGGNDGPCLSFRGIDNQGYYLLHDRNPEVSINHSGCGNTLKVENPMVMRMVTDTLRMWVQEYHIDGFRFDLAPGLGRKNGHYDSNSPFFQTIYQDPVLSSVKLIAEPWDLAGDGYQLGNFPRPWSEWNDRYRDCVRSFWRGDQGLLGQMAERLCGSSDIYRWKNRAPSASVNYICSHDGFTLHDLVSYSHKHNDANGEHNRDGDDHNFSWNCGSEGESHDTRIIALRERYKRSLLATLFLSNGVVMIQAGDEFGNTQSGNNNAYCQNNPTGWLNWSWLDKETAEQQRNYQLMRFVRLLIRARKENSILTRDRFLCGIEEDPENYEVLWRSMDGRLMRSGDWQNPRNQSLFLHLLGDQSEPCECNFLVLFNSGIREQVFKLPRVDGLKRRECLLDTSQSQVFTELPDFTECETVKVLPHSVMVLKDECLQDCPTATELIARTS